MPVRQGRYTVLFPSRPTIVGTAAVVGKKEGEGPLSKEFDRIFPDEFIGEKTFEKAESKLQNVAVSTALEKAGLTYDSVDCIFAGDLLNQCIGSTFGFRDSDTPFAGLYGACSTMALSLLLSAMMTDGGLMNTCVACTSSHFCSAERQYRLPLEYGGQRSPTTQWTVTGSGAAVVRNTPSAPVHIDAGILGRIRDLGVSDPSNMGAAMAPAAAQTIACFLGDTQTTPADYDLILTGDLGRIGSDLLKQVLLTENEIDISAVHNDCGLMIFDLKKQDVHAGGSGCGCSATVVCSHIVNQIAARKLKKVLFVGTGALLSPTSQLQGETVPGIAHGVLLTRE